MTIIEQAELELREAQYRDSLRNSDIPRFVSETHEEKAHLYERRMAEVERADKHALFWLACGVMIGFIWTMAILLVTRHIR